MTMDVEQKIKADMRKLGCKSEMKITLAYQLYIYLVDENLMYDTEYCYNSDIDTLYIVARRKKTDDLNIYVPIPVNQDISLEFINKTQENLCTIETGNTLNLAFIDGDSTTVIYSFTRDIVERQSQEVIAEHRKAEERRNFINNELRKSRNDILNDALDGGVVDEDDCEIID